MTARCMDCQVEIGPREPLADPSVTHGLCQACAAWRQAALKLSRGTSGKTHLFIDSAGGSQDEIKMFFHCRQCMEEQKAKYADIFSPREYARLEVGLTDRGVQVRCVRHGLNVAHFCLWTLPGEEVRHGA